MGVQILQQSWPPELKVHCDLDEPTQEEGKDPFPAAGWQLLASEKERQGMSCCRVFRKKANLCFV